MKFPPKTSFLKSFRGERINHIALLGEAIDNALDAAARICRVQIGTQEIRFDDDGLGVTRNRIESLFSLGDHGAMTSTQLGRFGVGIKAQAINAGDVIGVRSTSIDGTFIVQVNWREVLASGEWEADDPTWLPTIVGAKTGTIITLSKLRTAQAFTLDKIADELGLRFYPALIEGKQIVVNERRILAPADPKMTDIVECALTLSRGRGAQLRAGILAEPSKLMRVHVGYKHRVIMPASVLGCSDYGGLNKMFARVQLTGPWHLGKFKDDLTDEDERSELETAVAAALEPILEKCNSASISARVAAIGNLINDLLPPSIAAARPHHKGKSTKGGKRKQRTGFVRPENSEPEGPAKTKKPRQDQLIVTFEGRNEQDGIGSFEPGRPNRVNLSIDNPYIEQLLAHRDQEVIAQSLLMVALALFEQGRQERAPELPFKSFGLRIADLLSINYGEIRVTRKK